MLKVSYFGPDNLSRVKYRNKDKVLQIKYANDQLAANAIMTSANSNNMLSFVPETQILTNHIK